MPNNDEVILVDSFEINGKKYKQNVSGGTSDFDELSNRPKYNGTTMSHETNIPEVKTAVWDAKQNTLAGSEYIDVIDDVISLKLTELEAKLVEDGFQKTCFIEGTQITMADGTTKNIEDVKTGDLILSYDPSAKIAVTAMALISECTGIDQIYSMLVTASGSTLEIYKEHSLWCEEDNRIHSSKAFEAGDNVRISDTEMSKIISFSELYHPIPERHYNLVSSNNLYYANGILVGHNDADKYQALSRRNFLGLPEKLIVRWKACAQLQQRSMNPKLTPEVLRECSDIIQQININTREHDEAIAQLEAEDYKDNKAIEAFITKFNSIDTESDQSVLAGIVALINEFKSYIFYNRDSLRARISELREENETLRHQLNATRRKIFPDCITPGQVFLNSVTAGIADMPVLEEWFSHYKENK